MRTRTCGILISALFTVAWAMPATADNLIQNGSFENGSFVQNGPLGFDSLQPGAQDITNWTVINDELGWETTPNDASITAQDGTHFLDLTGLHNSSPYGGVSQSITTTTGNAYMLSLYLGTQQNIPAQSGPVSASVSAGNASELFTFNPSGTGTQWGKFSLDFIATSNSTTIDIIGQSGQNYIGLDNVSVTAVPEASSVIIAVMGLSGGGVLLSFRRRRIWS